LNKGKPEFEIDEMAKPDWKPPQYYYDWLSQIPKDIIDD